MKHVYLVLHFKNGIYQYSSDFAFSSFAAAERFSSEFLHETEIRKVQLLSISDF